MTPTEPPPKGGFGAQSHGNRKGLGGDPPNQPVKSAHAPRRKADRTEAQITDMQSEGPGQPKVLICLIAEWRSHELQPSPACNGVRAGRASWSRTQ